ncbi:hypothetical protein EDC96DRAFT_548540 [Choanephora cucurbitarum]|nr:hypothetical protein EDC96DRAFT_548540 [Choanephora cucurbitarum]
MMQYDRMSYRSEKKTRLAKTCFRDLADTVFRVLDYKSLRQQTSFYGTETETEKENSRIGAGDGRETYVPRSNQLINGQHKVCLLIIYFGVGSSEVSSLLLEEEKKDNSSMCQVHAVVEKSYVQQVLAGCSHDRVYDKHLILPSPATIQCDSRAKSLLDTEENRMDVRIECGTSDEKGYARGKSKEQIHAGGFQWIDCSFDQIDQLCMRQKKVSKISKVSKHSKDSRDQMDETEYDDKPNADYCILNVE